MIKRIKKFTAVVIGAGSIGANKDNKYDSPKTKNILTHAHAYYKSDAIDLIGIIDPDKNKLKLATEKWKTKGYSSIDEMEIMPDILSVCIPTE